MANKTMESTSTHAVPTASLERPIDGLEKRVSDTSIAPSWTEDDEKELLDIKAKLHLAHKSWSAGT